MSLFGKLKKLHSGAPALPRRTDDNARFEWPQDEFDEDDGDMYEVPPCERSVNPGPPRQVTENEYMERMCNPIVHERQPPPRPSKKPPLHDKTTYSSETTKPPPDVDRTEKPGRSMPPPSMRLPPISPTSYPDDDVYLDPNEEQGSCEELYLEPTDGALACSPPPPPGPKMMLPFPKTALQSPKPLLKPPVPRAKFSPPQPPVNELKTGPSVEARRPSFPPLPTIKPPLPASLKEMKSSPQSPPVVENKPVAYSGDGRVNRQSGIENKEWFAGNCNRKMAENLLLRVNKDGAFLIRHSSSQNSRQPYTLAVLYQHKVYNIPIRFLEETKGYALGKEGKKNEEIFGTIDEMISYHKNNQLLLIDSKSLAKNTTHLTYAAHP